jgi:hypothetical protein
VRVSFLSSGSRRSALLPVAVLLLGLGTAGCTNVVDKAREAANSVTAGAAEATVSRAVDTALQQSGISLKSGPDCDSNLTTSVSKANVTGTVHCTGTTTDDHALDATFDGTVAASGSCPGTFTVLLDGTPKVDHQAVDVCDLAKGVLSSLGASAAS